MKIIKWNDFFKAIFIFSFPSVKHLQSTEIALFPLYLTLWNQSTWVSLQQLRKQRHSRFKELSWPHIAGVQVWAPQPMVWTSFYNDCQILARENKILYYSFFKKKSHAVYSKRSNSHLSRWTFGGSLWRMVPDTFQRSLWLKALFQTLKVAKSELLKIIWCLLATFLVNALLA